jgi:hypothetical protein
MARGNGKSPRRKKTGRNQVLDEETRRRRNVLAKMEKASDDELVQVAVRAGILTKQLKLAAPYRDDADPSDCRPTD